MTSMTAANGAAAAGFQQGQERGEPVTAEQFDAWVRPGGMIGRG
jgi:hypothetical protein